MSLLTIARGLARGVGLSLPDRVIGSPDRTWAEVTEHATAAGEELARRVDWGQLTATAILVGNGADTAHPLPANFARITKGAGVRGAGGTVRPLTQAEWATLTATEGVPRYFLLRDSVLRLWPHMAVSATVAVSYQSNAWCSNGTGAWAADDDTALIDEGLLQKGLEVRWRRAKGMDYADHEAEYEAAIGDFARFNDRSRF